MTIKQELIKLKKKWGPCIYVCSTCGNVLDSEGYTLNKAEMGNNYCYGEIDGRTVHYTKCECGAIVVLRIMGK